MDIVDTLNHLIPSDQLDDSLVVGQNLECEASNEFCPGIPLEDSLRNMLSDKDPMFGCASSQFNLLDNEDPAFQIAGLDSGPMSSSLSSDMAVTETPPVKRPVGRPRKRPCHAENVNNVTQPVSAEVPVVRRRPGRPRKQPVNTVENSFLIEKGVKGVKLKEELMNGGRINVNDLEGGLWLQPTVVLKKLTVTIGGFRIELLPGPGYTQTVDESQASLFDGIAYSGDIGFTMLQDATLDIQTPLTDSVAEIDIVKSCVDDATLALGPYVNPNDVQTANGTLLGSSSEENVKRDNHSISRKLKTPSKQKEAAPPPQQKVNNKSSNPEKSPQKRPSHPLKLNKQLQGLTSIKSKVSGPAQAISKKLKPLQNTQSRMINKDEKHISKNVNDRDKKGNVSLKRPMENAQSGHQNKVQKTQGMGDVKVKPKLPTSPSALVKKNSFSGQREQHSPTKKTHSQNKGESVPQTPTRPAQSVKSPEGSGQEKLKVKKPEKLFHKQRSRTISVEEPELFIPDNAPVVKKESIEEQPAANNEAPWDGSNSCGLCKKPHNNMFMVGCGRCDDWFHGDCVGLDLTKVQEMEQEDQMYVCLKCCEEESRKTEPEPPVAIKEEVKDEDLKTSPTKPRAAPSQTVPSGGIPAVRKEPDRRQSTDHKPAFYSKHEVKTKPPSSSKKPFSVEQIRRSVRDSLKEILTQRLKESDLKVSVDRAYEIAKKTERELFHLYKDTDSKYKSKYRSLTFNLKDTKNSVLFQKVLKGEISPGNLIRMSAEELASTELAAWRQRENRHTIEMIEKEQRQVERRPITKITHKGEIEIESLEPVKAPETLEPAPPPKAPPVPLPEPPVTTEKKEEISPLERDTTAQHKSHLFDLHCKICTGRMAPPVEEAPTKVVKVATTVIRRQSTKEEGKNASTPPAVDDDLHLAVLEESLQNAKSGYSARVDTSATKDETAVFLSGLKSLWRGFIHMPAVAKLVTKAFPVSGILDHLTEDLPDSIQVGGRIGPQIVWDYLEKIRATGTKEVCLIRFSPETEEDEISYTLLYAYFSSRKRFGVVSNNLKQVKDMYLIPLGATEKIPHQLVPFDGPGLEINRPNLLLGLIIRQRPKRDFISVESDPRLAPELKHSTAASKESRSSQEEDEQLYLSSLTRPLKKEKDKPLDTTENTEEEDEPLTFEDPPASQEENSLVLKKPRFLPGVLVGWGGVLPPLPDVFEKSSSTAANDTKKTRHQTPKTETTTSGNSIKSPTPAAAPRDRFLIKKKDVKPVKVEPEPSEPTDAAKDVTSTETTAAVSQNTSISLKDKPPDVSTEAFLASLSTDQSSTNKGAASVLNEANNTDNTVNSESPNPQTPLSVAKPLSGILKKSSAYASDPDETQSEELSEVLPKDTNEDVENPEIVPDVSQKDAETSVVLPTPANPEEQTTKNTSEETSVSKDDIDYLNPFEVQELVTEIPLLEEDCGTTDQSDHQSSDSALPKEVQGSDNYNYPSAPAVLSTSETQERSFSTTSDESSGQSKEHRRHSEHHERRHHKDSHHKKSRHHDREREKKRDRNYEDKHRERSRHHGHSDERHSEKKKDRHHSDDYRHKERHRHRRDSDYENGRRSSRDNYS